ncbi:hypothetical protein, partial [Phascolarctobacterium faecium]|uniref:hypothetical protein n=10 Tax=Acidaminococcaceae TaxID=909930 RepID=UPI003AF0D8E5
LFRFVVKKLFLTWQTLLFQETLARTFVFGYCSVFKVLPAVFDDLYSILHLFDVVNYFFSSFLTAFFSYQLPSIASGDFHYLTRFYEKFQVLFSFFYFLAAV